MVTLGHSYTLYDAVYVCGAVRPYTMLLCTIDEPLKCTIDEPLK